jgi:hypothetical protein
MGLLHYFVDMITYIDMQWCGQNCDAGYSGADNPLHAMGSTSRLSGRLSLVRRLSGCCIVVVLLVKNEIAW